MKLAAMDKAELRRVNQEAASQYEDFKALHVSLNMARGKPCAKQLDLALGVLDPAFAVPAPAALAQGALLAAGAALLVFGGGERRI